MSTIKSLNVVNDYCAGLNLSALHPLVTVVDLAEGTWAVREKTDAVRYGFYGVFLKQGQSCTLKYGRQNYDYQDGTLVFIGPGQVVKIGHIDWKVKPAGHALLFHPDFLKGTTLGERMNRYSFFSYNLNEALHISQRERLIVLDCFEKIRMELTQGIDKHTKELIASNIEIFLKYCMRFYDRQFITRDNVNLGILEKFEASLIKYILSGKARELGPPTVAYFAEKNHLSPNYFGDLVKKELGLSAQEFIQMKIIEIAKQRMSDPDRTIGEVASELGFKYQQHFTRLFKKNVGYTPQEYRMLN